MLWRTNIRIANEILFRLRLSKSTQEAIGEFKINKVDLQDLITKKKLSTFIVENKVFVRRSELSDFIS